MASFFTVPSLAHDTCGPGPTQQKIIKKTFDHVNGQCSGNHLSGIIVYEYAMQIGHADAKMICSFYTLEAHKIH